MWEQRFNIRPRSECFKVATVTPAQADYTMIDEVMTANSAGIIGDVVMTVYSAGITSDVLMTVYILQVSPATW